MVLLTFPILLSLAAFGVGWGSALRIEIQPPIYAEGSSGPVNVSCQIDRQDSDGDEEFMLKIMKDGEKPLVVVRPSGIQLGSGVDTSKFLTEGHIYQKDISTSYIKLGILDPTSQDEGKYTCFMHFIDKHHQVSDRRASANFLKSTLNDVVMMLRGQVATLEGKLEAQTSKVSDQQGELDGLRKENQQQNEKMKDLAATVLEFSTEMRNTTSHLKEKDSYVCGFHAQFSKTTLVDAETDIVLFRRVKTNLGGGFNVRNGVFTAPRNGLYVFTLGMTALMYSSYCCQGRVDLYVNGASDGFLYVKLAKRSIPKKPKSTRYPHSTLTRVVSLTKGDTVNARTKRYKQRWTKYSHFSGFLLKEY